MQKQPRPASLQSPIAPPRASSAKLSSGNQQFQTPTAAPIAQPNKSTSNRSTSQAVSKSSAQPAVNPVAPPFPKAVEAGPVPMEIDSPAVADMQPISAEEIGSVQRDENGDTNTQLSPAQSIERELQELQMETNRRAQLRTPSPRQAPRPATKPLPPAQPSISRQQQQLQQQNQRSTSGVQGAQAAGSGHEATQPVAHVAPKLSPKQVPQNQRPPQNVLPPHAATAPATRAGPATSTAPTSGGPSAQKPTGASTPQSRTGSHASPAVRRRYPKIPIPPEVREVATHAQKMLFESTSLIFYNVAFQVPLSKEEALSVMRVGINDMEKSNDNQKLFFLSWAHSQLFSAEMASLGYRFIKAAIRIDKSISQAPPVDEWLTLEYPRQMGRSGRASRGIGKPVGKPGSAQPPKTKPAATASSTGAGAVATAAPVHPAVQTSSGAAATVPTPAAPPASSTPAAQAPEVPAPEQEPPKPKRIETIDLT